MSFRLVQLGRGRTAMVEVEAPVRRSPGNPSWWREHRAEAREYERQRLAGKPEPEPLRFGPVRFIERLAGQCVHILPSGLCCGLKTEDGFRKRYCAKHDAEVHGRMP